MSKMTLEECNVSLFDECQKRGQEIAKLEQELQEARELLRDILENWRNGIEENEIIKFIESEAE